MAKGHKPLRCEVAIGELVAEEDADDRRHRERIKNPRLLTGTESQARQVPIDQRQPRTPDDKLQNHHQEQAHPDVAIHRLLGLNGALYWTVALIKRAKAV